MSSAPPNAAKFAFLDSGFALKLYEGGFAWPIRVPSSKRRFKLAHPSGTRGPSHTSLTLR
jgi:hypothetical protein